MSDSATPWTVAHQAPPSMGFSRQEYWSGVPFPSPGDLPNPGIEPRYPALQADTLTSEPPGKPIEHLGFCKTATVKHSYIFMKSHISVCRLGIVGGGWLYHFIIHSTL